MRSSSLFAPLLATLAAAQSSVSVVVTDGVTSTIVLPGWPSGSSSSSAASATGTVLPSVTITVVGGTTSGVSIPATTFTIVPSAIPANSTFGPGPFGVSTSGSGK